MKTTGRALLVAALFTPSLFAKQQAMIPTKPVSGSGSASPFPGFSWSAHPQAFKDVGKPVEYQIQIASHTFQRSPL